MRKPRNLQLSQNGGIVHEFWQMHNRKFQLSSASLKHVLLKCLKFSLKHKKLDSTVKIHALCFMDNHIHQIVRYDGPSLRISNFMKLMNGEFARCFHKIFGTSGAVMNGRPKTSRLDIENQSPMSAHLYVEANPIRTGHWGFENLKYYTFNSFRYYAYGIVDEVTEIISPPEWYVALGSTPQQRQRRYRSIFRRYVQRNSMRPKKTIPNRFTVPTQDTSQSQLSINLERLIKKAEERLDRLIKRSLQVSHSLGNILRD